MLAPCVVSLPTRLTSMPYALLVCRERQSSTHSVGRQQGQPTKQQCSITQASSCSSCWTSQPWWQSWHGAAAIWQHTPQQQQPRWVRCGSAAAAQQSGCTAEDGLYSCPVHVVLFLYLATTQQAPGGVLASSAAVACEHPCHCRASQQQHGQQPAARPPQTAGAAAAACQQQPT